MKKQSEKAYTALPDPFIPRAIRKFFLGARTCLDIGCGNGQNMRMLRTMGIQCVGLTISQREMEQAQQYGECLLYDIAAGFPPCLLTRKFDVVLASHVIEHIFYPQQLLSDIKLVMSKGAIFAVPNILYWRNRAKLMLGIWQYQELGIMDYTHCRFYSYDSIHELLRTNKMKIIFSEATGGFFRTRSTFLAGADKCLLRSFPGLFGEQFYLVIGESSNE